MYFGEAVLADSNPSLVIVSITQALQQYSGSHKPLR